MRLNNKLEISTTINVSVDEVLDYILDLYQFKNDKVFEVIKYIIENTDNDWENKMTSYFKSKK